MTTTALAELAALCESAIPTLNAEGSPEGSFSMPLVSTAVLQRPDLTALLPGLDILQERLLAAPYLHHLRGILRSAFFIEPVVLPAARTTRFRTHWQLDANDQRYASPEDCLEVARQVVTLLVQVSAEDDGSAILNGMAKHPMVPYELPSTYLGRPTPIHSYDNVGLIDLTILRQVVGARLLLLGAGTSSLALLKAAYAKVRVKTYLTDRAVTGAHKTNREKRWESHPDSVQFAQRSTCIQIERVLVNQLSHFEGFPADVRAQLDAGGLLLPLDAPTCCPVTLLPMSFSAFQEAAADPEHGRSPFQVGHLDPLKLEGNVWANGHRPDNISWISEDGNRVQGSLSLQETRNMLRRIWDAYSAAGLL